MRVCKKCHKKDEKRGYPCTFEEHSFRTQPGATCEVCREESGDEGCVECKSYKFAEEAIAMRGLMPPPM